MTDLPTPYARSVHRRSRLSVAAAGLAAAVVAVGVPTAINTFSSPGRPAVAAPSTAAGPTAPMVWSVEEIAARIASTTPRLRLGAPQESSPCPDASDLQRLGVELEPGGSPLSGCVWAGSSNGPSGGTSPRAYLRYYEDELPPVRAIGCPTAIIPGSAPVAEVKQSCATGSEGAWGVTIPAAGGEGGWLLTAADGTVSSSDVDSKAPDLVVDLVQLADQWW
jgi:hypothetical protein